jgi:ribose/xylose/arabinose/galactoside ABC-type transport system permease subunit
MSVVVCIAVIVLLTLILRKTRFGHNVYFTGANPLAAKFSGIAVNRLIVTVFVIAGALSGFSGVLYTAKVNACDASMYMESHFDAVSVALISGASLLGGYGNMWGSAVGALIISSIKNGMNTLQVPSEYQTLVLGVLIILSVFFNDRLVKKKMGSTERISTNKTEAKAEAN